MKTVNTRYLHKAEEYKTFIEMITKGEIPETWELTAKALGVHRNVITAWKRRPEFAAATKKGLERALAMMEKTGGKDWRMWKERYSILANEQREPDVTINAEKVVAILGGNSVSGDPSNQEDPQAT